MSATTMAAATQSETADPPLAVSPPGKAAAPPASDAAMSVHTSGHRARDSRNRAGSRTAVQAVLTKV
jgi:hypothetical protein